jgi:hypothetical protein
MADSNPPPSGATVTGATGKNCQTCHPCPQDPKKTVKDDILHGQPASDPNSTHDDWMEPQPNIIERAQNLSAVNNGTMTPDPNSRLGAYAATSGYPDGTVGNSVHNAIGTIYMGMANIGQEDIGKVFNSPEAKSLYNDPVNSPSSKCMAKIEYSYWQQVRSENGLSIGGQAGSAFGPGFRNWLQQNVFSPSQGDPPAIPWGGT